ncbi:MAG: PD40 domain-containing protein, partial [Bryobacterales bacterium]|nr:PD40 domain-containing protein [Bryobacterales bacterium]
YVQQLSGQGTVRLTSDPAADTQPAFSADGAKVYFASAREPAGIYEVPTLGGDARLVMAGALSPSASPDGKWLACVRGGRVLVRPVSGGEGRVASAIRFSDFRPVWSPDGTRLAVMSGGDEGLSLIPVEGSSAVTLPFVRNLRRLGMFDQSYSVVQAWTPDGDLLFSAPFGSAVNIWRIPLRDAAGGRPAPVTLGSSELLPSFDARAGKLVYNAIESVQSLWSLPADLDRGTVLGPLRPFPTEKSNAYHQDVTSDGRFLAYVSRKGGTHGIWLMEVATGRERLLVQSGREDESYAHLQFSPNGSRIAATYSGYQGQGADRKPAWHIFVLDVAAGQTRQVARPGGRIRGWSPDGRYLVVWSSSQPVVVGVVDVESGALTPILKREGTPVGQPRLSPDGRWIAFLAGSALHVAPFRGNQPVPEAEWVRVAEPAGFPFWSPDGRNLYYTAAAQWEPVSALLLRQPFDPAAGRPKGPAVRFHALEGRTLGSPIINQVSGARGGVVLGLRDTVSDIWSLDWPPR